MKTFPLDNNESYPESWSYEFLEGKALQDIISRSCILNFEGIKDTETVYNPCPFVIDSEMCLLGRVEAFTSEIAHVHQFAKVDGKWHSKELSFLNIQDPFLSCIQNQKIVGGVALDFTEPFPGIYKIENYRTSFFDFETKQKIIDGPNGMKDIRLVDLGNKIGVFTRPRTEDNGIVRASIQFSIVDTLSDITAELIDTISIDPMKKVSGFFSNNEWGGVNAVYQLTDGWLGVLGHIAYYNEGSLRKYAAIAFEFHPETKAVTHPVIILGRNNLATDAKAKREDLHSVIFPGGFIFLQGAVASAQESRVGDIEKVLFFYGLGDAHIGVSELPYPFHHMLDQDNPNNQLFLLDRAKALATVGLTE